MHSAIGAVETLPTLMHGAWTLLEAPFRNMHSAIDVVEALPVLMHGA